MHTYMNVQCLEFTGIINSSKDPRLRYRNVNEYVQEHIITEVHVFRCCSVTIATRGAHPYTSGVALAHSENIMGAKPILGPP